MLAAEYALGILRGSERTRLEAGLIHDPELRRLVAQWEERLLPLAITAAPMEPSVNLWANLQARIAAVSTPVEPASPPLPPLVDPEWRQRLRNVRPSERVASPYRPRAESERQPPPPRPGLIALLQTHEGETGLHRAYPGARTGHCYARQCQPRFHWACKGLIEGTCKK
jgi:hypothetical protein